MESDFFTATTETPVHETQTLYFVLGAIVFVIVLALVLLCLCRARKNAPAIPDLSLSATDQVRPQIENPVELLIPPLFYTEGLRDPLMQEDLRERVTTARIHPSKRV
jgi:hypothetical protein